MANPAQAFEPAFPGHGRWRIPRGEVHAEVGGRGTLVALMQQTLMVMRENADA